MGKKRDKNHQLCCDLMKTFPEASNAEILEMVQEKYKKYTIEQVQSVRSQEVKKSKNSDNQQVQGDTEYTPKHKLTETGYRVYYAGTYIDATHEEIRKALILYCIGGKTMNQVALAMTWTRAEFNAIKTAFKITKDSPPFTPYEIDNLDSEEMAEIMRIEKKRYALEKFNDNKYKDIEKEIDRHNKDDYWLTKVSELINSSLSELTPIDTKKKIVVNQLPENKDIIHLIKITDEHSGLNVKNIYNTYNFKVMEKRFAYMREWISSNIPIGDIIITSNGDLVHGIIHGSVNKHSTYMIDSFHAVTMEYIKLFKYLIELGYKITFAKANGSHSSIEKAKKDRTEEDNLGRTLPFVLKQVFFDNTNVRILNPTEGTNNTVVPIFDYGIMTGHGDEMTNEAFAKNAVKLSNKLGIQIKEVHLGHIHEYMAKKILGVLVEHTEAFCGSDQYAARLGLDSGYGFTHFKYSKEGREGIKFIDLSKR